MIKIQELIDKMDCEIDDAKHYAEMAVKYKAEDKELSELYSMLASEELNHFDKLHSHAVRIIQKYRDTNGEPPAEMKAIWDWEHKKLTEKVAEIKVMIEMAKKNNSY